MSDDNSMSARMERAYAAGRAKAESALAGTYLKDKVRCLAAAVGWPVEELLQKIVAFDRERLDAVPDLTVYPELRGQRDLLLEGDRGARDGGLDHAMIAATRTMDFYCQTRLRQETGKAYFAMATPEKCRVLYVPDSDVGALHAKNVDDPATYFTPLPPMKQGEPWEQTHPLWFDGVGSGLHIDEIPPEIFPADPRGLCPQFCDTAEGATEFLVRYNYFWGGQNLLVHDEHGNSAAFEKTTCRVAVRGPNAHGLNFITGMGALDPGIRAHQRAMRQQYLDEIGDDWDGPEGCFWKICEGKWDNMARYVEELSSNPTLDGAQQLMEKRDPSGPMCCTGQKSHPDEKISGWTLIMRMVLMDKKQIIRRQYRNGRPAYLDPPEIVQFT